MGHFRKSASAVPFDFKSVNDILSQRASRSDRNKSFRRLPIDNLLNPYTGPLVGGPNAPDRSIVDHA